MGYSFVPAQDQGQKAAERHEKTNKEEEKINTK